MRNHRWEDGAAYERFMGRWSRLLAEQFVSWLAVPRRSDWLEIGCGTGSLTSAICQFANPRHVTACDTSLDFVDFCREHLRHPDLRVVVASTDALPPHRSGYDVVASNLVLNFLPEPVDALKRMRGVCTPHGIVAACVWDYAEGMEFLRVFWDAAVALDSDAIGFHEGVRFPLCNPEALRSAFAAAGLEAVEVTPLVIRTPFASFDDYWAPFVAGPGPAPTYLASLSAKRQEALADRLRTDIGASGHPIQLAARGWAVRGLRGAA
jgi:trans-aconitate methyltransferase